VSKQAPEVVDVLGIGGFAGIRCDGWTVALMRRSAFLIWGGWRLRTSTSGMTLMCQPGRRS